jgi:putative glycosyltransferase (TIGR04372 family)
MPNINYVRLFDILLTPIYAIFSIIFIIILIVCYPFIFIRVGPLGAHRFGHYAIEAELYLCEFEKLNKYKLIKYFDLWFYSGYSISNDQYDKMIKRKLRVMPLFLRGFFLTLEKFLAGTRFFINVDCLDRDINNYLEKSNQKINFIKKEIEFGNEWLKKIGINNKKYVCLLVRDDAYISSLSKNNKDSRNDHRNSNINDFIEVSKYLISKNYYVIRMGSKVKKRMDFTDEKFIDYPFQDYKSAFLDIYIIANCEFSITTGTGLDSVCALFRKPIISVNFADFNLAYSWFPYKLCAPKKFFFIKTENKINIINLIELLKKVNLSNPEEYSKIGITYKNLDPIEIVSLTKYFLYLDSKILNDKIVNRELIKNYLQSLKIKKPVHRVKSYPKNFFNKNYTNLHGEIYTTFILF